MNIQAICSTIIIATVFSQPLHAIQNYMTFKNQRGSILELNISEDNKIDGSFTTAVASKSCPEVIGKERPIVGYTIGNAITFSVFYPVCNSVLSITGNFDKNKTTIDTVSILNHQSDDVTHEGPGARFIGHDTYTKTN